MLNKEKDLYLYKEKNLLANRENNGKGKIIYNLRYITFKCNSIFSMYLNKCLIHY